MSIEKVYTLNEMISEGRNNNFINSSYCKFIMIGNSKLTISGNILDKYIPFINGIKMKVALTSDEYMKYKYNPKQLCLDLYGSEEISSIILKINNISHESEFIRKKIYILDPSCTIELLNKIISINEDVIKNNHLSF